MPCSISTVLFLIIELERKSSPLQPDGAQLVAAPWLQGSCSASGPCIPAAALGPALLLLDQLLVSPRQSALPLTTSLPSLPVLASDSRWFC